MNTSIWFLFSHEYMISVMLYLLMRNGSFYDMLWTTWWLDLIMNHDLNWNLDWLMKKSFSFHEHAFVWKAWKEVFACTNEIMDLAWIMCMKVITKSRKKKSNCKMRNLKIKKVLWDGYVISRQEPHKPYWYWGKGHMVRE